MEGFCLVRYIPAEAFCRHASEGSCRWRVVQVIGIFWGGKCSVSEFFKGDVQWNTGIKTDDVRRDGRKLRGIEYHMERDGRKPRGREFRMGRRGRMYSSAGEGGVCACRKCFCLRLA